MKTLAAQFTELISKAGLGNVSSEELDDRLLMFMAGARAMFLISLSTRQECDRAIADLKNYEKLIALRASVRPN